MSTAAPHCHELSRQSPSRRTTLRVRACVHARVHRYQLGLSRQCAAVRSSDPPPLATGLPPVGHDVGTVRTVANRRDSLFCISYFD
jgi:hypothetical protein